jgi:hypothetical protein
MNLTSFLALLSPAVLLPHILSAGQVDQQQQLSVTIQTKPTRMIDLAEWTRSHLEPLFVAHEDTPFAEAYASVFSSDVSVRTASVGEKEGDSESSDGVEKLVPGKGARAEEANGADAKAALEKYLKGAATTANARVEWGDVAVRDGPVSDSEKTALLGPNSPLFRMGKQSKACAPSSAV